MGRRFVRRISRRAGPQPARLSWLTIRVVAGTYFLRARARHATGAWASVGACNYFDDVSFGAISLTLSGMGDGDPWQQRGGARQWGQLPHSIASNGLSIGGPATIEPGALFARRTTPIRRQDRRR